MDYSDIHMVTRTNWPRHVRELILDSGSRSGVGFQGPRGSGVGLQGPKGSGVVLQGPRGSRGRPTGSQGVKGEA